MGTKRETQRLRTISKMADKKQRLVYSILEFLQASMDDGTIKQDDKEGIEVAIQCIGEAFSVDMADEGQKSQLSVKPANLQQIFDVYLKTKAKSGASASTPATATDAPAASTSNTEASSSSKAAPASAADVAAAEKLKGEGNALMASKNYSAAIAKYTEAVAKNPSNPVYYSNRAAAHSQAGDHDKAIDDANKAKEIDPKFAKAYSRLGHALFSLGRYSEAADAYEKGLELEPANASMKGSLVTARARAGESSDADADEGSVTSPSQQSRSPPANNPFAGLAGLGGGGGMPDLGSLLNNPQLMSMAQQMMANGGLEQMMQNPMMRQMAERFSSGGGMPDMSQMMNDPSIRQMAEQFGRGAGGAGRGSGGSNGNSNNNPD